MVAFPFAINWLLIKTQSCGAIKPATAFAATVMEFRPRILMKIVGFARLMTTFTKPGPVWAPDVTGFVTVTEVPPTPSVNPFAVAALWAAAMADEDAWLFI